MFTCLKSILFSILKQKVCILLLLFPVFCFAQSKNTQIGRAYSQSIYYGDVTRTTTTGFKVHVKKKWNTKKIRKKKNKESIIEHELENNKLKSIKKYYIKNDSIILSSSQLFDDQENLILITFDHTDSTSIPISSKYIYNSQGNIDSIINHRGPRCTSVISFVYDHSNKKQSEYTVSHSRGLETFYTQKIYEYKENKISTVSYFKDQKELANTKYHYTYNEKELLVSVNNFNYPESKVPNPLAPKTIVYQYDEFSNITKEKVFWNKNFKIVYDYIYQYDKMGNWISQVIVSDDKIIGYYERTIEYK